MPAGRAAPASLRASVARLEARRLLAELDASLPILDALQELQALHATPLAFTRGASAAGRHFFPVVGHRFSSVAARRAEVQS